MTAVFVAGSRTLGRLNHDIRARLSNLTSQSFRILIGDANGTDKAVQNFLREQNYRHVIVYCSGEACRNNIGSWPANHVTADASLKGRAFYTVKDKQMASDSDYGLMIWDGKSNGTFANIMELVRQHKKTLVYLSPRKMFLSVSTPQHVRALLSECDPQARTSLQDILKTSAEGSSRQDQTALAFGDAGPPTGVRQS